MNTDFETPTQAPVWADRPWQKRGNAWSLVKPAGIRGIGNTRTGKRRIFFDSQRRAES